MTDSEKLTEQKITSKEVFKGRLLHAFSDEVRLPDGATSTREWIKHPGAAAVLPVFPNGDVMLIKQFRYPLDKVFCEVPAGKIDAGEEPEKTAIRELEEEAGLICRNIHFLAGFHPTIGYSDEIIHLFCAWDLNKVDQQVDSDEFVETKQVSFEDAVQMVYDGKMTDGKSMVNILLAWNWWQQEGPFEV
ncbi:MAG TPA: NUDIX hydrolase [Balneolaceae bacterium]|nr:NUDIX hydrolase [Balneolaceae bacterium]